MSLISLTALSLSEIVGDFGFKAFARAGKSIDFGQGILGYVGVIYFLIRSFRVGNVMYVNGMWDGMSTLLETLAAYIFLGERLNSVWQYIGIVLLVGGLLLVRMGGIAKN
jgi:multidrug transporter EmrE-like cation transporter